YLSREFPVKNSSLLMQTYPLLVYFENLNTESTNTINTLVTEANRESQVQKASVISAQDTNFEQEIDSLEVATKVDLLEQSLINIETGVASDRDVAISNKFKLYWYRLPIPEVKISNKITELVKKNVKQGKRSGRSKSEIRKISREKMESLEQEEEEPESADEIYVHILWIYQTLLSSGPKYSNMAILQKADTRYRLYQPDVDAGFRDASSYETQVYNELIQVRMKKYLEPYVNRGLFGSSLAGVFRLHNVMAEKEEAITDNRFAVRGRICNTFNINELIDFIWELQIEPPGGIQYADMSRDNLIYNVEKKYTLNT